MQCDVLEHENAECKKKRVKDKRVVGELNSELKSLMGKNYQPHPIYHPIYHNEVLDVNITNRKLVH